jgi:hypothetical protein
MQAPSTRFIATCPAVTALRQTTEETNTTRNSGRNGFTVTWSEQGFANPTAVRMLTGLNPNSSFLFAIGSGSTVVWLNPPCASMPVALPL